MKSDRETQGEREIGREEERKGKDSVKKSGEKKP